MNKWTIIKALRCCIEITFCDGCPLTDRGDCMDTLLKAVLNELSNPMQPSCNPDICMYMQELRNDVERLTVERDKLKEYIKQTGVRHA